MLGGAVGAVLPDLPPIQRRALEAALLLGEPGHQADARAVAAAFLAAVRLLAAERPICLAIDDLQWLDAASTAALRFSLTRLAGERVLLLLAVRGAPPEWLRRSLPDTGPGQIEIGGLSTAPPTSCSAIAWGRCSPDRRSSGFGRRRQGTRSSPSSLAAPCSGAAGRSPSVRRSRSRLRSASCCRTGSTSSPLPSSRSPPSSLSSQPPPSPSWKLRWVGAGACLNEALAAKIVELDDERVRFTHPLLGTAVTARLTPARRRSLHARLAEITPNKEEGAHHLARATAEPDESVARFLEEASRVARARGAQRSRRARGRSAPTDACSVSRVGVATAERGKTPPRGR